MSIADMFHSSEALAVQSERTTTRPLYEGKMAFARAVRDRLDIASYLEGLADEIAARGDVRYAERLWEAAETLRDLKDVPLPPPATVYEHPAREAQAVIGAKPSADPPARLTEREMAVLRLIAQGMTNPQVAVHLIISLHTVNAHVRSIFNKVEVNSRCALTRYAIEHGLL